MIDTGECPFCYADFVSAVTSSFSSKVLLIASTRTCISKAKTNYHIHLVFCERKMLEQPEVKIATRNMFCDEQGKHRRTKKEEWFKNKSFTREVKELFTDTINRYVKEESENFLYSNRAVYIWQRRKSERTIRKQRR